MKLKGREYEDALDWAKAVVKDWEEGHRHGITDKDRRQARALVWADSEIEHWRKYECGSDDLGI